MSPSTDAIAAIRKLYYGTTKATVARDLERAIDLLKAVPDEEARERAAVYMDGLAQMRSEWGVKTKATPAPGAKTPGRSKGRRSVR
jgi:hypothetical protein